MSILSAHSTFQVTIRIPIVIWKTDWVYNICTFDARLRLVMGNTVLFKH